MKDLKQFIKTTVREYLNEGLIKTYPTEKVINFITTKTPIKKENIWVSSGRNDTDKINIDFDSETIKYGKKIEGLLNNVYGYYLANIKYDVFNDDLTSDDIINVDYSAIEEVLYDEEDTITFIFEKKYDNEYIGNEKILYHITDEKYLNKIKQIGLIPKSKSKISVHPDRIYLMLNREDVDVLYSNIDIDIDNPVILEVDISNLNLKLYSDPNMPNAVYTLSNIPPKNIKITK